VHWTPSVSKAPTYRVSLQHHSSSISVD
jgi:hypothetical protein